MKDEEKKKRVPKLRFPGYTGDWKQYKLGELSGSFEYGLNAAAKEYDGKNKYIRITDIDDETRMFTNSNFTSPDVVLTNAENYRLSNGDIVFARTGASVGKTYIYKESDGLVYYAGFLIRARIKPEYSAEFVFQNTLTKSYERFICITSQRSGQPGVNAQEYADYKFFVPGYKEQKQLGSFFSQIDHLIILHQCKINNLKEMKKGLLQKMFPKDGEKIPVIRFPEFTDDWEQRELGDIGETYTGLSGKTKEDFGHGDARFVTYMNVYSNPIADKEKVEFVEIDASQNTVQYGDVFFTTSSETPEEVGMSCVWIENTENTYLNSFCFGYRPSVTIDPYFMAYVLRSDVVRRKIIFLAQGISRYNISKNKVMEIEIPLPSIEEQKQLGQYFNNIDKLITLHQRKINHLKELKKGLLQQMFV